MPIEPTEFSHNEAWLFFQLNDIPVRTADDGDFNAMAIMEVASGMIFGMELVALSEPEVSEFQSRKLLDAAENQSGSRPKILIVAQEQSAGQLASVAESMSIIVERVGGDELAPITKEAIEGFAAHVSGGEKQ